MMGVLPCEPTNSEIWQVARIKMAALGSAPFKKKKILTMVFAKLLLFTLTLGKRCHLTI